MRVPSCSFAVFVQDLFFHEFSGVYAFGIFDGDEVNTLSQAGYRYAVLYMRQRHQLFTRKVGYNGRGIRSQVADVKHIFSRVRINSQFAVRYHTFDTNCFRFGTLESYISHEHSSS